MAEHQHPLEQLNLGLKGLHCAGCRQTWVVPAGVRVIFQAVKGAVSELEDQQQKQLEALLALGGVACEECGEWFSREGLGFVSQYGVSCPGCFLTWYEKSAEAGWDDGQLRELEDELLSWFRAHREELEKDYQPLCRFITTTWKE